MTPAPKPREGLWSRYWFRELDARPIAVLRLFLGVVIAWMLLERVSVADVAYSDDGWIPNEAAVQLMDRWHWSLFHYVDGPVFVRLCLVVGAVAALGFAVGAFTRASGLVALVVLASMHVRNPAVLYGADSLARIFLVYLLLADSGAAWSVDAVRRRVREGKAAFLGPTPTLQAWPVRLFQWQVAAIYLFTGINKAYGVDYHEGTTLWYAVANPTYSRLYFLEPLYAALYPMLSAATQVTLWWEVAWAFMVPFAPTRKAALAIGVVVHGGIFVALDIEWWGPLMLASYLAFVEPHFFRRAWLSQVRAVRQRRWDERLRFDIAHDDAAALSLARRVRALDVFGLVHTVVDAPRSELAPRGGGAPIDPDAWQRALRERLPRGLRWML